MKKKNPISVKKLPLPKDLTVKLPPTFAPKEYPKPSLVRGSSRKAKSTNLKERLRRNMK